MPQPQSSSGKQPKKVVSLRHVAEVAGVSRMSVSRAFREDAAISPELRQKILKVAKELGYTPDTMVSELMTSFASRRPVSYQETFAAIWSPQRWAEVGYTTGYHAKMYRGLNEGAKIHGRVIDHIVMTPDMSGRAVNRILRARNIQGVILTPPMTADEPPPELDWEHLSAVVIGSPLTTPNFHRAHASHYNVIVKALETLQERKYKRPCLLVHDDIEIRTCRAYSAAFLAWGHPQKHIWKAESYESPELSAWLNKVKPDVIIADWEIWHDVIPFEDINCGFVALSLRSTDGPISGIYQNIESIAKSSVDLLISARLKHEQGEPKEPMLMLTRGTWVEGATLRSAPKSLAAER